MGGVGVGAPTSGCGCHPHPLAALAESKVLLLLSSLSVDALLLCLQVPLDLNLCCSILTSCHLILFRQLQPSILHVLKHVLRKGVCPHSCKSIFWHSFDMADKVLPNTL